MLVYKTTERGVAAVGAPKSVGESSTCPNKSNKAQNSRMKDWGKKEGNQDG